MKRNYKLTCILLLLFFYSTIAYSETYYISKNGSDGNSGTMNSPWKTIGKANASLNPGDKVIIRGGVYQETIKPSRSGKPSNYIIYTNYENEEVVISGVSTAIDLSKDYIKIEGLKFRSITHNWANITGHYNIIDNCNFEDTDNSFTGWEGISLTDGGSHNKVINNYIKGSSMGPDDLIYIRPSSYNLIMGNTVIGGLHNGVSLSGKSGATTHNIIKNNKISNRWHTSLSVWKNADHTIIEGNIILNAGEDHAINYNGSDRDRSLERSRHKGFQMGANNCIVRSNTLSNNGAGINLESYSSDFPARDNTIYNNTFYKNYSGFVIGSPGPVDRNILKNNIFASQMDHQISRSPGNEPYILRIINNNFNQGEINFSPAGDGTVSEFESKFPKLWQGNMSQSPQFQNPGDLNFKLQSSSTLIDKGAFLTQTTSSGSGTSLIVEDGRYFTDGHGLVEGDVIQLEGQNVTARIVKKDGNKLTLDRSLTWKDGQGVSLNYGGKAPEIGAFEIDGDTPTTSNTPPSISAIEEQAINSDSTFGPVNFTISDEETTADDLTLSTTSSNQKLVKNDSIKIKGTGAKRSISITPEIGKFGTTTITVIVSDGEEKSSEEFVLTIKDNTSKNSAPSISSIDDQVTTLGESLKPVAFTIGDKETPAEDLTLSAKSSNQKLILDKNLDIKGSGEAKTLSITPVAGQIGTAKITVTVSDGKLKHNEIFALTVNATGGGTIVPTISSIPDKTIEVNNTLGPITFTVGTETMKVSAAATPENLTLTATSSNEDIVTKENIVIEGAGTTKNLSVTPNKNKTGSTTISIAVSNGKASNSETFKLTIVDNSTLLIQSFTLVNAKTDKDILTIKNGMEVNLAAIGTKKFNIRANASKEVNRVVFGLNGDNNSRKEGEAPYALFGDSRGDYFEKSLSVGGHELIATPYLKNGAEGKPLKVNFTVIDEGVSKTSPSISTISDQVINQNSTFGPVHFTINDKETKSGDLSLSANSSNQELVKNRNIKLGGSGEARSIILTPERGQSGTTKISITVSDGKLESNETFVLTVEEANDDTGNSKHLVQSFTLVDAKTNEDILIIKNGSEIDLATIGIKEFNIRANASSGVKNIVFGLNEDRNFRKEGEAPYALFGDLRGDYFGKSLSAGKYKLTATPYLKNGVKGRELQVNFTVVNETSNEDAVERPDSENGAAGIVSFTLVDAETNVDITTLKSGDVINLSTINAKEFDIRANSNSKIEGVVFDWNGKSNFNKEKEAPYALFGDSNGDYFGNELVPGRYTITARSIGAKNGFSIHFEVIDEDTPSALVQRKSVALNIYPNPFIQDITIDLDKTPTSDFTVHIYDNAGNLIFDQQMKVGSFRPGYRYKLNLSNTPLKEDEVYYLKITGEGSSSEVIRLIKK